MQCRVEAGAFREHCSPRSTVLDTLAKLQSTGVKTGLISDCGSEVPDIWPGLALAPLMDATVFSCCVGVTKPDPSMYRLACERLGVDASRCLYVGDGGSRELTGARAMGMTRYSSRGLRKAHGRPPCGRRRMDRAGYFANWRGDGVGVACGIICAEGRRCARKLISGGNRPSTISIQPIFC